MPDLAASPWVEELLLEAERRVAEVESALEASIPVLRALVDDTAWQSRTAEVFRLAAEDLERCAAGALADAVELRSLVASARWRAQTPFSP